MPLTSHRFQRWFVRGVLTLALVSPAILFFLARGLNADRPYSLDIEFTSSVDGTLQVFYDRGAGITEAESAVVRISASTDPVVQHLPIPGGTYRRFRIDPPGLPGRFAISSVRVLDWNAHLVADLPLTLLAPASQVRVLAEGPPLVVESPPGSNDPQLLLTPATPLVLHRNPRSTRAILRDCLTVYVAVFALLLVSGRALVRFETRVGLAVARIAGLSAARPATSVVVAALAGTLAAMYPVVFLGASLVSPNNGAAPMLYDHAPFTPGQPDRGIEVIRGVDNGAATWAFVPYSQAQRTALTHGEVPLWNRYNAAGRPLWGQGQSQLLDPLHWATLVAPDPGLGWDVKFVLHRTVFAAGVGFAVLALTASLPAAMLMALVAPFAGYFLFRLNHPAQFSFTYAAWMMWAWFRLVSAAGPRAVARAGRWLAATTVMVLVASPPKEALIVLLCGHVTGALACLFSRTDWGRRFGAAALAGLAAILLAAPHWLVFASTLAQSLTDYDNPAARFATFPFAIAFVFGSLNPGSLLPGAHVVVVAVAVAALATGRSTWGRPLKAAAALGPVLALAVAFGAVPERAIVSIPFFANIHQIDYTFIGAAVVLTFIAGGVGTASLLETAASGTSRIGRHTVGAALACAAGSAVLLSYAGGLTALNLHVETWALLLTAVLGTLLVPLLRIAANRWPSPLPVAAVAIVTFVLLLPDGLHAPSGVRQIDDVAMQPRGRARLTAISPAVQAIHRDAQAPARVVGAGDVLFSGTQALYDLEGIAGPDALQLPKYEELIKAAGVQRYWMWNVLINGPDLPRVAPLLDLLNVGYVVVPHRLPGQGLPPGAETLVPLPMTGEDLVLAARRPTAWPRAFFVDRLAQHRDVKEFVAQLNASNGPFASVAEDDARSGALGEEGARVPVGEVGGAPDTGGHVESATNYKLGANRTSFRVHATGPGVAVLTEAWMANDFIATLNGTATPYVRVNYAFKGVRIPAEGDWTVEFRYRPALWTLSWAMAALGALGLIVSTLRFG